MYTFHTVRFFTENQLSLRSQPDTGSVAGGALSVNGGINVLYSHIDDNQ